MGRGKPPIPLGATPGWGAIWWAVTPPTVAQGGKRSLVVEAPGGPRGATIAGANGHDTKLLAATLEALVVERPLPPEEKPQHLCLDKGDDHPTGHETVAP